MRVGVQVREISISDSRTVVASVENKEPLYTPKGQRPIDPCSIRITYGIDYETRRVWSIRVEVNGYPLNEKRLTPVTRRLVSRNDMFGLPRGWLDLDQAPAWVQDVVKRYSPEEG